MLEGFTPIIEMDYQPRLLGVIYTNTCNRRCAFCFKEHGYPREQFMSPEDFTALRAWAVENKVEQFKLAGGEPTQHPRFAAMTRSLRELVEARHCLQVISNLLCSEEKLDGLRDLHVLVNTDSPDQYQPDELKLLLRNLEIVSKQNNLLALSFTIWRLDQPEEHLFEYIERFGAKSVRMDLARPSKLRSNRALRTADYPRFRDKFVQLALRLRAAGQIVVFDCPLPQDFLTEAELQEIRPARLMLANPASRQPFICDCVYINPDLSIHACPHQLLLERKLPSFSSFNAFLDCVFAAKRARQQTEAIATGPFCCEAEFFLPGGA